MKRPVVWFRFRDLQKREWVVILTSQKLTKSLRKDKHGGPYHGRAFWSRRIIYANVFRQTYAEVLDTLIHELIHIALRGVSLPEELDEAITSQVATRLALVFAGCPFGFPEIPEEARSSML